MKQIEQLLWGLLVLGICPSLLVALPTSSEVVSGDASFAYEDDKTLIIQAKDRTIIQHEQYSIAEGEKVRYIQPNSSSVVLSRVTGKDPSNLLGNLESNGRVFLVNPNGVYFGKEAKVDVGALIVSTLNLTNEDFIQGKYLFSKEEETGSIVNLGSLQGEEGIAFLSTDIRNEGTIVAKTGTVLLAAGEKITLDFLGDGLMKFVVEGTLEQAMIEQAGNIEAFQGNVYLTVGSIAKVTECLINTDGIQIGEDLIEKNGRVYLTEKSQIVAKEIKVEGKEGSVLEMKGSLKAEEGTVH
ncbi:MAG: filamentous hemagglutinin N-terminal domain-containing protein, partial [Verrucomicrobia bacterium]|nr:filamentous hemagglutinin N-terminal domain-containing protein [Verrucomicrobiota bacterium]